MIIVHTIIPDEEVDSVKSDAMCVGDDNDGTVVGL